MEDTTGPDLPPSPCLTFVKIAIERLGTWVLAPTCVAAFVCAAQYAGGVGRWGGWRGVWGRGLSQREAFTVYGKEYIFAMQLAKFIQMSSQTANTTIFP